MLSLDRQNYWRERYRRDHPEWQPATEVFAAWVRKNTRPNDFILDLGCGRGGLVEQLSRDKVTIIGADPDIASLREHRLPTLPRTAATSIALPYPASSLNVVYAAWLLEHLEDPYHTWTEVQRVLKPDGVFIFITPNIQHPLIWCNRFMSRFKSLQTRLVPRLYSRAEEDTFPAMYRSNSTDMILSMAARAGMRIEQLLVIPDPTYLAFSPSLYRLSAAIDDKLPIEKRIHLVGMARRG